LIDRVDQSLIRGRNPESILVPPSAAHAMLPRRSGPVDGRQSGRVLIYGAFAFALIAAFIAWSGTESFDRMMSGGKAILAAQSKGRDVPPVKTEEPATASAVDPISSSSPASVAADGAAQPAGGAGADAAVAPASTAPGSGSSATPSTTPSTTSSAAPSTTSAIATSTTSSASDIALSFHFNEPSWVEVRAADGKVLLQRLNAAGSEQQVEGAAPFSLIVGNAKGVELRLRGQPVDLTPYTRDQVARLTLS